jgi:Ca2+:H+ antiporter
VVQKYCSIYCQYTISCTAVPPASALIVVEILGSCFFLAGYKTKVVEFNVELIGVMSSLMIVSAASLVIPSASYFADRSAKALESSDYILTLSHIAAIILFVFYIIYLVFQLKTHADIFADHNSEEPDASPELDPWIATFRPARQSS